MTEITKRVTDIVKRPGDKREYCGIELSNKLRILLISDPETDKSAASMSVGVGHLMDPWELPGLAHFCEHMLFLGTEKYPIENEYKKGLIGRPGYGEIFLARDLKLGVLVAIKAEPKRRKGVVKKRMMLEQEALCRLQGRPHVPVMYASGHEPNMNFIVMQFLSKNLGDLRKGSPKRMLSQSTVARIMIQGVAALRDLHTAHYLHRDVKPGNMCFRLQRDFRHILILVDYGLVRKFKTSDGHLIQPRSKVGFRGTTRYASIRVHARMDQSTADDLVSMAYSGLELLLGNLPWKYAVSQDDIQKEKEELEAFGPNSMLHAVPEPMAHFCLAIFSLHQTDEPNYSLIQDLLFDMTGGRTISDPYDWQENGEWKEAGCPSN